MKLAAFLLRYLRRHLGWVAVAGVAAVVYAVTTVSLIGLIEHVLREGNCLTRDMGGNVGTVELGKAIAGSLER